MARTTKAAARPAKKITRNNRVSILNWMGTLLVCSIPGVSIIAAICFLIFGRAPAKKTFAWAILIWSILLIAAYIVLALAFPHVLNDLSAKLHDLASRSPEVTGGPLVQVTP